MRDYPNLFRCPSCKNPLDNSMIEANQFACPCGLLYEIIDEIPIFLDTSPDFASNINLEKIDQSFSQQWDMFDYDNIDFKTWDWDFRSRLNLFFNEMLIKPSALKNKWVLDAGCGNGELTSWLSLFGCNIVGIDISDSVFRAKKHSKNISRNGNGKFGCSIFQFPHSQFFIFHEMFWGGRVLDPPAY